MVSIFIFSRVPIRLRSQGDSIVKMRLELSRLPGISKVGIAVPGSDPETLLCFCKVRAKRIKVFGSCGGEPG